MNLITLTQANFEQIIGDNEIVFIDFWAEWCGPCLSFAPIYDQVAKEFPEVSFAKVNIEQEQQLAADFQIRSIPQLMVFKNKVVIFSESGVLPPQALRDLVIQAKKIDMSEVIKEIEKQKNNEETH